MKNLFFWLCFFSLSAQAQNSKTLLFVGTYSDSKPDKGIFIYQFDTLTGDLQFLSNGESITNPSFIAVSPNGKWLYACTETKAASMGNVSAFEIDSSAGKITFLNKQSSAGANPVFVNVSKDGRYVLNGNYSDASVSIYKIRNNGGLDSLSQCFRFNGKSISKRQEKAHIHSCYFSPDEAYVYLPDLGADSIRAFRFQPDSVHVLENAPERSVACEPGSGPRHMAFHPNGAFAYCVEELSGNVSVYMLNQGFLSRIQLIFAYSKKQEEYNSADIHISPDGLFLYASNRFDQENTIAIFAIDPFTGLLELKGHQSTLGDHPRNFTLDKSGRFLLVANQLSNAVVVFKRDEKTGMLSPTGKEISVPRPSCLVLREYQLP
jgi:6-phosphogluconolactonase (cycloisomerase 2 family)